jgi:hypothetical protein
MLIINKVCLLFQLGIFSSRNHQFVEVHIKEQPSTRIHGYLTIATARLVGIPSSTWLIQILDEIPPNVQPIPSTFYALTSATNAPTLG